MNTTRTTDRIFEAEDGGWYFHVRGNQAVGPFDSFHQAESALGHHVSHCRNRLDIKLSWPRLATGLMLRRRRTPRHG